jgi:biopolymer transport protein ExbB
MASQFKKPTTQLSTMLLVLAVCVYCMAMVSKIQAAGASPTSEAASSEAVSVSVDGSASQPEKKTLGLIPTADPRKIIRDAGPLMYAILLCSFLLVGFTLERCVSLRHGRVIPRPFVKRFMSQLEEGQLDREQALELCKQNGSPVAQVFAGAVRKWGRPGVEVEQGVIDAGERATNDLRRYLRVFYAVATVGPLLGLMGTVLGMIQTFNVIADPSSDAIGRAAPLAGGIAKALLNTAGGLSVAIPASLLYVFFVSRVDRLVIEIDRLSQEVVNVIAAEEMQEHKISAPKARRSTAAVA